MCFFVNREVIPTFYEAHDYCLQVFAWNLLGHCVSSCYSSKKTHASIAHQYATKIQPSFYFE